MTDSRDPSTGWQITSSVQSEVLRQLAASPLTEAIRAMIESRLCKKGRILAPEPSPLLSLLAVESFVSAGGRDLNEILPVAAAMEFFIAAADVVDDLQDEDYEYQMSAGDAGELVYLLLVCAHRSIGEIRDSSRCDELLREFTSFELIAMGGQHDDIAASLLTEISLDTALGITTRKSGTFGRCATHLGAMLANQDARIIELHAEFGSLVTTIAQLSNDIAGVWPEGPPSTDIILRRKTVPIAIGLHQNGLQSEPAFSNAFFAASKEDTEYEARQVLLESGAIHATWKLADTLRQRAEVVGADLLAMNPHSRLVELVREPVY